MSHNTERHVSKILIVTPYFYPAYIYGGPIEISFQFGKAWAEQGHRVTVVTTNANGNNVLGVDTHKPVEIEGMIIHYCKRTCLSAVSVGMIFSLWSQILKTDVVCLHFVYSFSTIPAIFLSKIFRKKLIWYPQGALQVWSGTKKQWLKKRWNQICRLLLPANTIIIFAAIAERNECKNVFFKTTSVVIPNGVIVPLISPVKELSPKTRLLFIGRIDPIKGIENLLNAMLKIDSTRFTLDIYGQGDHEYVAEIKNFISVHKLGDRVVMHGGLPHENLAQAFGCCDIFVLPSFTENFGMVVSEALAHSVPVIVSNGAPWKKIEEIGCGLWVPNDAESLAQAINTLCKLDLADMGRRGREWVSREFDWSECARKVIDSLESLSGS